MSLRELYTSSPLSFLASEKALEDASWAFLGVPLDATSTVRPGSRLGPLALRRASLGLEVGSLLTNSDLSTLPVCDVGDLHVSPDLAETLERLELVVAELLRAGKRLAVVGGEHTITLGVARGLIEALGGAEVLLLDAHLDLRDEFLGQRICHATVARRLLDLLGPGKLAILGARTASREEIEVARENDILIITSREVRERGTRWALEELQGALSFKGAVHVSLDLDVLDPSFAPAVQAPEPFGLSPWEVLELLLGLVGLGGDLRSVDVVELAPLYDSGQTATLAARLLVEFMWAVSHQA